METLQTCVLLVDDEPANLATLEAVLEPLGQRLVLAGSGSEALRRVLEEDFAVILLDVRLGDMSGLEVMALLRSRERSRRTPVLLLTAGDVAPHELLSGYAHGAVDYLSKPFIPEVLRAKVSTFVELQRAREQLRRQEARLAEELHVRTQALDSSEQRLRLAMSATALGTWDFDPESRELRWDARTRELFAVAPDVPVTYELFDSRIHPEDRAATHAAVASSLEPTGTGVYDVEYRNADASRWLRATGRTFFERGRAVRFIGTLKDISAYKFAEQERTRLLAEARQRGEQLRQSEQQLRALANSMPQLVWVARPDGQVDWYNDRWCEYTGLTPEQLQSGGGQLAYLARELPDVNASWDEARARGEPWEAQFHLRRADGSARWFLARAVPMRDAEGRIVQWFGTNTDIDDERRMLEELRQAEEEIRRLNAGLEVRVRERTAQLQEANRELESFSYSVSHDLRAPLRHILGFAQLLERRASASLDENARGLLRTITQAAQQGGTLVDDLLSFSRMGRAELRQSRVDLDALVREVRRELEPELKGRQVEWHVGALPEVQADPSLLRQVLRNLLGNAVKYTRPRDPARIEVEAHTDGPEVEIRVRDNGVGFEMQYVDKLFGVFQRLHTAEQFEGTGIGLANVRRIISRHGGRTWAEGALEQGATFHFTLPRAPS